MHNSSIGTRMNGTPLRLASGRLRLEPRRAKVRRTENGRVCPYAVAAGVGAGATTASVVAAAFCLPASGLSGLLGS